MCTLLAQTVLTLRSVIIFIVQWLCGQFLRISSQVICCDNEKYLNRCLVRDHHYFPVRAWNIDDNSRRREGR